MKKYLMALAMAGIGMQSALAAPIGWYDLSATWRDGTFSGRIYYDNTALSPVTKVKGTLTDLAQTTSITSVFEQDPLDPQPWVFLSNAAPDRLQDAGFYLTLVDLGASLTLDLNGKNGLFDWSRGFAYYTPEQLDDSPLQSFSITREVPEPGSIKLIGMALVACALLRPRRRKCD